MPDAAVQITTLTHRYGERVALSDLSIAVPSGSIFGLLGPNGSGKSTLFRILSTLLRPTSGNASVAGFDVVDDRELVRRRIGVVFQYPSLDAKLTIQENMVTQARLYGLSGPQSRNRIGSLLNRFGLSDRAKDRVAILSGGLQRRVELAKAMLHQPEVLILDEPSTGLDPGARISLMDLLHELKARDGVTSVLTTHSLEEADRCDQLAVLERGKLMALDTPERLKSAIGGDVLTVTTSDAGMLAAGVKERFGARADVVDGVVKIERNDGFEFVPRLVESFPGMIQGVSVGKPTLADVFVRVTGHRWDQEEKESR